MAVPPPADRPGPQPPQPGRPAQPGHLRPPPPGRTPTRSPGNPSPIDRALLAGARHPAASADGSHPTLAVSGDGDRPTGTGQPVSAAGGSRPSAGGDRQAPKQPPQPHPRPTAEPRSESATPRTHPTTSGRTPASGPAAPGRTNASGEPDPRPVDRIDLPGHGVRVRPVVHVEDMAASVAFYQRLGAEIVHGGPDGEWVLIQLGTTQIDLITRPPRAERGECTVELNVAAEEPLDLLRERLRVRDDGSGVPEAEFAVHPELGEHLEVRTPDGLLIKISQLEPDL